MQILRPWPRSIRSETLGQGPSTLGINEPSRWFRCSLKFENYWSHLGLSCLPELTSWVLTYLWISVFLLWFSHDWVSDLSDWIPTNSRFHTLVHSWDFHLAYYTGALWAPFPKYIIALLLMLSPPGWPQSLALNQLDHLELIFTGASPWPDNPQQAIITLA